MRRRGSSPGPRCLHYFDCSFSPIKIQPLRFCHSVITWHYRDKRIIKLGLVLFKIVQYITHKKNQIFPLKTSNTRWYMMVVFDIGTH